MVNRLDVFFSLPKHESMLAEIKSSKYGVTELCKLLTKLTDGTHYTPNYTTEGTPFISVTNVIENNIDFDNTKFISIDEHNTLSLRCKPEPNDILLTKVGSIGRAAIIPNNAPAFSLFVSVALLKLNNKIISSRYLCAYLNTRYSYKQFERHLKGIGVPDLHLENIATTLIIYPKKLTEQEQLCEKYYHAHDSRKEKLRKADELLAGMDGLLLKRLGIGEISFTPHSAIAVTLKELKADNTLGANYYHPERLATIHLFQNNKSIKTRKLSDIAEFLRITICPKDSKMSYLGLSGVVSNTGELSGVDESADGQAFEYQANDVLYARLRPYLNKVLLAETGGICSTEFHVMRVSCDDVLPAYLAAVMRSKIIVSQTKHMMTGNTHPRISNDDVRNLRLPIPNLDVQREIVDDIKKTIKRVRVLKQEAESEWAKAKEQFERELMGG